MRCAATFCQKPLAQPQGEGQPLVEPEVDQSFTERRATAPAAASAQAVVPRAALDGAGDLPPKQTSRKEQEEAGQYRARHVSDHCHEG